jgi:hypothetical protein
MGGGMMPSAFHVNTEEKIDPYKLSRGENVPDKPILFRHYMGRKTPLDVIGTSYGTLIFSSEILSLLENQNITGWTTYPVTVYGAEGEVYKDYAGFSVIGRCGPIKKELSTKQTMPPRVPWAKPYEAYIGYYFDLDTWDGSDIFVPEGTYSFLTIEKVKNLFVKHKFKNIYFDSITEMENPLL